jgi:hypothetical protein
MAEAGNKLTEKEKVAILKESVPGLPAMDYRAAVKNFHKASDMVEFLKAKRQVYI